VTTPTAVSRPVPLPAAATDSQVVRDSELLTVPEVMAQLKVGRSAVYDLLRTRQLLSITLGRARRIPAHALSNFIRTRLEQEAA
jgi:excisionase family DNA binding protein